MVVVVGGSVGGEWDGGGCVSVCIQCMSLIDGEMDRYNDSLSLLRTYLEDGARQDGELVEVALHGHGQGALQRLHRQRVVQPWCLQGFWVFESASQPSHTCVYAHARRYSLTGQRGVESVNHLTPALMHPISQPSHACTHARTHRPARR